MTRTGMRTRRTWFAAMAGMTLAGFLVVGSGAPAHAEDVVIDNTSDRGSYACSYTFNPVGQTFVATATGHITEVGFVARLFDASMTVDLLVRAGGAGGTVLGTVPVTFTEGDGLSVFTIDPIPVEQGQTYALELSDWTCSDNFSNSIGINDAYPDGSFYDSEGTQLSGGSWDLLFRVLIDTSPLDADGDGVVDARDICADTTFSAAPADLKPNHYWSSSADGFVDPTGSVAYSLADTAGCSAEQIIAEAGLGKGHQKSGLSIGELRKWIASVAEPAVP